MKVTSDARLFQSLRGVEDRVMFDGGGDDVLARLLGRGCDAEEREIVGFRATTGEDDFRGLGPEQCGY